MAEVTILPILPHIAVNTTRLCDGDDDVNCYYDLKGCNTNNATIFCNDVGGWSASLAFIGTGALVQTGTTCSGVTCQWTVDGEQGCSGWFSEARGGIGATTSFFATGLDGDDITRHTLTVSSTEFNQTDVPTLRFYNGTRIYTGPDTPVHPEDYIAISPYYSEMELQGEWSLINVKNSMSQRRLEGGEGSISLGIVGDAFQMGYSFSYDGPIEDDDVPIVNRTINGEVTGAADGSLVVPLDPGGWYNLGLKVSFNTSTPIEYVNVYELIYHPLDNITRIRDIIPESLVESWNDSPPLSNELGCAPLGSGAASHLREGTGTFLLLPMIFIWYALRLKF